MIQNTGYLKRSFKASGRLREVVVEASLTIPLFEYHAKERKTKNLVVGKIPVSTTKSHPASCTSRYPW